MRTLLERDLIRIAGRQEVPGRPLLYETTDLFLEYFGLSDIEHLPRMDEIESLLQLSAEDLENAAMEDSEDSLGLQ